MNLPSAHRTTLVRLEVFADRCGLHPDLIQRFVSLGLIDPTPGTAGEVLFTLSQVSRVDRMIRLRSDLGLNYNALGLVVELLERIEQLERAAYTTQQTPQE
jgi:DNA-binding transcriptional MerR regulator